MSPSQNPPPSRFKNRQIHFRRDLLFVGGGLTTCFNVPAAWLRCHSMWEREDVEEDVFGRCPFPDSTPTSSSPARDMFWSSASLHPSGPITGDDGLNMAPCDSWERCWMASHCKNTVTSSPEQKQQNLPLWSLIFLLQKLLKQRGWKSGVERSLEEDSVHKLDLFDNSM